MSALFVILSAPLGHIPRKFDHGKANIYFYVIVLNVSDRFLKLYGQPTDHKFSGRESETYCNDPKFSDRQVWANSLDPDQTASV